ncbi:MAG: orotidine-5'-phosphate decarboxylase [Acidimicrobiia bacterium]|nr:orotidine-5'-phosphate decarboxylase [Acidimicrobiia bacterium]
MVAPLIVALDVDSAQRAVDLAAELEPHVAGFKVGLGLLARVGPGLIERVAAAGRPVFVDVKLHDIPVQVQRAATEYGRHGARWITAHASGGAAMLEAAVEGFASTSPDGGVLAVTVLTSLDDAAIEAVGIEPPVGDLVASMAAVADRTGCEGAVCSTHEISMVRAVAPRLISVVPGIRPQPSDDDQARTATPDEATMAGADYLVVGRPITGAADPAAAAAAIAR